MPFIDLNKELGQLTDSNFDVTIIGAGAAGILLAVRLTKAGKRVLVIESGHFKIDDEKQKLNEVENVGKELVNAIWGRKRAIGGTTLAWGGQSLPFTPIDFSYRAWIQNSGWPIPFESVASYYNDANVFMGVDTLNYHEDIFEKIKIKDPGFNSSLIDFHVSKWAKEPNFLLLHRDFLKRNVTVIYNAQLTHIHQLENKTIGKIEVENFKKEKVIFGIKTLIIAAGGIESTRILLNNNIGNQSGWLGKCFMEHPCIELGDVITDSPYKLQKYFNTHLWKKNKYSTRFSLSPIFQESHKTLNCSASIMFRPPADKFDPYAELVSFKKDFKLSRLLKVSKSADDIIKSFWAYCKDHFYYKVNADNKLVLMIEQEPVTNSYISLSAEKDVFGLPKARLSWHITSKTWETVIAISEVLKTELHRLGFGEIKLYDYISQERDNWDSYLSDVNHHMGGCRMSSNSASGVVDADLRVWDV